MKRCTQCGVEKPLEDFGFKGPRLGGGRKAECRPCANRRAKAWRDANPHLTRVHNQRRRLHASGAGMTVDDLDAMADAQDRRCAICGRHESESVRGLHLDHDHITGKVRALLCHFCNTALGGFQDSAEILHAAASYLDKHKEIQ